MIVKSNIKIPQEIFVILHDILHYYWDPIHIKHAPGFYDEYDSYISKLYGIICTTATYTEIFNYLWYLETIHMAITNPDNIKAYDRTTSLAKKLFAFKDNIINNNFITNYKINFVDALPLVAKQKMQDGCIEI